MREGMRIGDLKMTSELIKDLSELGVDINVLGLTEINILIKSEDGTTGRQVAQLVLPVAMKDAINLSVVIGKWTPLTPMSMTVVQYTELMMRLSERRANDMLTSETVTDEEKVAAEAALELVRTSRALRASIETDTETPQDVLKMFSNMGEVLTAMDNAEAAMNGMDNVNGS